MEKFEDRLFNEHLLEDNKNLNLLFEQYKLYVELTDKMSERRQSVNTFFLSLNSILVTGLTIFLSQNGGFEDNYTWIIVAALAGIVSCLNWNRMLASYKQLSGSRFKVIHLLESRLPAQMYKFEWDILGQGKRYTPFTKIELLIPIIFLSLYVLISIFVVLNLFWL